MHGPLRQSRIAQRKQRNREATEEDARKVRRKIVKGPLHRHEDLNLTLQTVKNPQGF